MITVTVSFVVDDHHHRQMVMVSRVRTCCCQTWNHLHLEAWMVAVDQQDPHQFHLWRYVHLLRSKVLVHHYQHHHDDLLVPMVNPDQMVNVQHHLPCLIGWKHHHFPLVTYHSLPAVYTLQGLVPISPVSLVHFCNTAFFSWSDKLFQASPAFLVISLAGSALPG